MRLAKLTIETACWNCRKEIHVGESVLVDGIRAYCIDNCAQKRIRACKSRLNSLLKEIQGD